MLDSIPNNSNTLLLIIGMRFGVDFGLYLLPSRFEEIACSMMVVVEVVIWGEEKAKQDSWGWISGGDMRDGGIFKSLYLLVGLP